MQFPNIGARYHHLSYGYLLFLFLVAHGICVQVPESPMHSPNLFCNAECRDGVCPYHFKTWNLDTQLLTFRKMGCSLDISGLEEGERAPQQDSALVRLHRMKPPLFTERLLGHNTLSLQERYQKFGEDLYHDLQQRLACYVDPQNVKLTVTPMVKAWAEFGMQVDICAKTSSSGGRITLSLSKGKTGASHRTGRRKQTGSGLPQQESWDEKVSDACITELSAQAYAQAKQSLLSTAEEATGGMLWEARLPWFRAWTAQYMRLGLLQIERSQARWRACDPQKELCKPYETQFQNHRSAVKSRVEDLINLAAGVPTKLTVQVHKLIQNRQSSRPGNVTYGNGRGTVGIFNTVAPEFYQGSLAAVVAHCSHAFRSGQTCYMTVTYRNASEVYLKPVMDTCFLSLTKATMALKEAAQFYRKELTGMIEFMASRFKVSRKI